MYFIAPRLCKSCAGRSNIVVLATENAWSIIIHKTSLTLKDQQKTHQQSCWHSEWMVKRIDTTNVLYCHKSNETFITYLTVLRHCVCIFLSVSKLSHVLLNRIKIAAIYGFSRTVIHIVSKYLSALHLNVSDQNQESR